MLVLILLLLNLAVAAHAQVASSTLLGEVRDGTGALIPGAEVTVTRISTGFSRRSTTNPRGAYRIDDLQPGVYKVQVNKAGFRSLTVRGVLLEINQKLRLTFDLQVGREMDSITVSAQVSQLQTEDASQGYRLDSRTITSLPLGVRNVFSLMTLGPGVVPRQLGGFTRDIIGDLQAARGAVSLNPPINGARSTMNVYLFDGAYNTDRNTFAMAVNPLLETVQEFRIQTSLPSAEFAQAGGGMVDVVSKSGSTAFHGSGFEFFRNEAFDARNFFDAPSLPRPIFRQNQYGGSLGGRVPLSSTFFFASYEGLRGKLAKSSLNVVPTRALRGGDFRGRNQIFDPLSIDTDTFERAPFPDNRIPGSRIDIAARRYLANYEPLPNRAGQQNNYLSVTPNENVGDNASGRIDHQFKNRSILFGRYTINDERDHIANNFPERKSDEDTRSQQVALGHTASGKNWFNEMRASFTRFRVFDVPESAFKTNVARELGMSGLPADPFTFGLPSFLISGISAITDSSTLPQIQRDNFWHLANGVSINRGEHTVKFGLDYVHFQLNYLQSRMVRGQYIFTGAFTSDPHSPEKTGDGFADFLLGLPQVTSRNIGTTQAYLRQNSQAYYFQDEWKVARHLVVTLGLRYEYNSPYKEIRESLLNLDYSRLPRAPRLTRVSAAVRPDKNNFAPRAGLAWRLPDNSIFRAGYGIYFSPEISVETYDLIRNGVRNERDETDGIVPILSTRIGFPRTAGTGLPSYFGVDPGARTPYMQQWNASLQHELPAKVVLEAAYVGSKGTKLGRFRTFNTPQHVETGENLAPRAGELQALRPFPALGQIIQRQHISNSSYHSLQVKVEKRVGANLAFLSSFVWSKSIDDADSVVPGQFESFGAQDERNLRLERGLSFFNVGRRFSGSVLYNLPAAHAFHYVLKDWQVNGIVTVQDGTPLNPVYLGFDPANSGTPNRPDVVAGQPLLLPDGQRTADHYYNPAAFQAPKAYTFGNAGRNILPGPGSALVDLDLIRSFPLGETAAIEFRAECFNIFNHPNYGKPSPYPDFGAFFGKVSSTGEPRRFQFAIRFDF